VLSVLRALIASGSAILVGVDFDAENWARSRAIVLQAAGVPAVGAPTQSRQSRGAHADTPDRLGVRWPRACSPRGMFKKMLLSFCAAVVLTTLQPPSVSAQDSALAAARDPDERPMRSHAAQRAAGWTVLATHGAGAIVLLLAAAVTLPTEREGSRGSFIDGPTGGQGLLASGLAALVLALAVGLPHALWQDEPATVRLTESPGDFGLGLAMTF